MEVLLHLFFPLNSTTLEEVVTPPDLRMGFHPSHLVICSVKVFVFWRKKQIISHIDFDRFLNRELQIIKRIGLTPDNGKKLIERIRWYTAGMF